MRVIAIGQKSMAEKNKQIIVRRDVVRRTYFMTEINVFIKRILQPLICTQSDANIFPNVFNVFKVIYRFRLRLRLDLVGRNIVAVASAMLYKNQGRILFLFTYCRFPFVHFHFTVFLFALQQYFFNSTNVYTLFLSSLFE